MNRLLVGRSAPVFRAKAVVAGQIVDQFSLEEFRGEYIVFFFYPLDFTFVCPTELHAFQEQQGEFVRRGARIVACSVDSPFSHCAWLGTARSAGGIQGVNYPIVSDIHKTIARDYQVLDEEQGIALRGLFLLDTKGVIRHQLINDAPIGRSVAETLRLLDALIHFEKYGEVCPANWRSGTPAMSPTFAGRDSYFSRSP